MRRAVGGGEAVSARNPEISVYRWHTVALLRRYFRMSIELGRLPTVLGREFFRAKVTSYRMQSFEDVVILVHDVERCIERLDPASQQVVARVILQEHSYDEAAAIMGWPRRSMARAVMETTDRLSEMFLKAGLLEAFAFQKGVTGKSCQEGEDGEIPRCA
ncbi:MAG: sigma factor-like helix-turn-helix DNA-binding protein [Terriglobales bacterium]